jgi:hypothetical protein
MSKRATPCRERKRAHIDRGERAFLPLGRMREVRWEESVARSEANRAGLTEYTLVHGDCHCGSISCLCVPMVRCWDAATQRWIPAKIDRAKR